MVGDPLSDILSLVDARTAVGGGFTAGGRWALRFPAPRRIKFYAVVQGTVELSWEGGKEAIALSGGDVVALSAGRPFRLASDLAAPSVDAMEAFSKSESRFIRLGDGDETRVLGGHVALDPVRGALLTDVLPSLIHVRGSSPEAAFVGHLLTQLAAEVRTERAGKGLATNLLTQLMFVQILRAHLAASETPGTGWLRALADARIAPTIHRMHAEPGRAWSLDELAGIACMSRSAFALHFKQAAGVAPLTYLLNWRMRLAERALREGSASVSSLALSLGYTSESAFSAAFKRVVGIAPKHYRNRADTPG